MRQLTLIRHAVTEWNTSGRFQGHTDIPLSETGLTQVKALTRRMAKAKDIDLVVSSPLCRASRTAQLALPDHELTFDERLKELNFGVFEGRTLAENMMHEAWDWWFEDPFKRCAPNGESYEQLRERAVEWMYALPELGHVVAFTHSGTIQMLVSHVMGVEHPRWRKRIFLRHTGITRILFRGNEAVIERVNDAHHLSRPGGDPFLD